MGFLSLGLPVNTPVGGCPQEQFSTKNPLRPAGFALKFHRACDRSHPQKS
jgi:hypothetical protein